MEEYLGQILERLASRFGENIALKSLRDTGNPTHLLLSSKLHIGWQKTWINRDLNKWQHL